MADSLQIDEDHGENSKKIKPLRKQIRNQKAYQEENGEIAVTTPSKNKTTWAQKIVKRILPSPPIPPIVQEPDIDQDDNHRSLSPSGTESFECCLKGLGCICESIYLWEEGSDMPQMITCICCKKYYHIPCTGLKELRDDYICCKGDHTETTEQEKKTLKTVLADYGDLHVLQMIDINSLLPGTQLTHRLVSFILNHFISTQNGIYLFPMWLECPPTSEFRCSSIKGKLVDFGNDIWTKYKYFLFPILTINNNCSYQNGHYNLSFWIKVGPNWYCVLLDSGNPNKIDSQKSAEFVRERIINRLVDQEDAIHIYEQIHLKVPIQPNEDDCGICSILFVAELIQELMSGKNIMDCLSKLEELDFSQERLNETRNILKFPLIYYQKTSGMQDKETKKSIDKAFTSNFLLDALCHTSKDSGERLRVQVFNFPMS